MSVEKIVWTALPWHRAEDGRLRLSVFVSPRLSNGSGALSLKDFPSFSNWPQTLADSGAGFGLDFGPGVTLDGLRPQREAEAWLWELIFPPDTLVTTRVFQNFAQRNLHVFPVRPVLDFLQSTWAGVAQLAGVDPPPIDDASGPLGAFQPLETIVRDIRQSSYAGEHDTFEKDDMYVGQVVEDTWAPADADIPPHLVGTYRSLRQAYRFYYRPWHRRLVDQDQDYQEPPPEPPDLDFHQRVALLGDHPELLRRLGLIIDLVFPDDQVGAQGLVRVVPPAVLPAGLPLPSTHYELQADYFAARPREPFRMEHGLLRLSKEVYDLYQVDVDGAAMKAVDFADTLRRMADPERRGPKSPDTATVPALRSGGLAVARTGRGQQLLGDLVTSRDNNQDLEDGKDVELWAEDLVRGYRIDVHDADAPDGPRWFSLHARRVTHRLETAPSEDPVAPIPVADEGYLKGVAASSERPDHENASDDLYLHEALFGWDGWSLAAPRPGKRIVEPGEGEDGGDVARFDPLADNPLGLLTTSEVAPGTLPRLRFGHRYRLRARTVDLAGNSLPFSEKDLVPQAQLEELVTEEETYRRFEPLTSPTLLRRRLDTEGESLEHLVVRSDLNTSATDYAASQEVLDALTAAGAEHAYHADSQRHLAPPKTSQEMAEQLGAFEAAFGPGGGAAAALRVALREEGTFLDPLIVDTATGQKTIPQPGQELYPASPGLPQERGAGLARGQYAYFTGDMVLLPYLPDPLARGVAVTGYDQSGAEVFHQEAGFSGKWPDLVPFRLRLSEGPVGVAFANGVLEVTLPQAEVVQVRLSSLFDSGDLDKLAMWDWIPSKSTDLEKAALEGRHWMLTPFRRLTLTHAVQRPLLVPDFSQVTSHRVVGGTSATFDGPIACHAKSTGRLDVMAEWTEDLDLLTDDLPRMRALGTEAHKKAHAFGFDIEPDEDAADVTHGTVGASDISVLVAFLAQAKGKLSQQDASQLQAALASPIPQLTFKQTVQLKQALPDLPQLQAPMQAVTKARRLSRHEFGDTKYRRVTYHSVATTRFREFFPTTITSQPEKIQRVERVEDAEGQPRAELVHDLLSTARPAAPDVVYAVPTVEWDRPAARERDLRQQRRRGNSVRVYLRRPWFSSGDGELLGVLMHNAPEAAIDPRVVVEAAAPIISSGRFDAAAPYSVVPASDLERRSDEPPEPRKQELGMRIKALTIGAILELLPIKNPLEPYLTDWGSDPVWKSAHPRRGPRVWNFPAHVAWAAGLTLDEVAHAHTVTVAAHEVHFDRDRKLWYADIDIDLGDTYFPFVRLALARYQPNSLTHAHLSPVISTDFIQLLPDRTAGLRIVNDGATAHLTVKGFSGRNIVADRRLQGPGAIPWLSEPGSDPNTRVVVQLEERHPALAGDLAWRAVGAPVELAASFEGFEGTWSGSVELPPGAVGGDSHRLLITELEEYLRAELEPGDPRFSKTAADFTRERVVYADVFEL